MNEDENVRKARVFLLRYLAYRARTGKEAFAYLERKGFGEKIIYKAIQEMQEYGYLDDERYTKDFISYRKARNFGTRRIRHELLAKGIDRGKVDSAINKEQDEGEEEATIRTLLARRVPADNIFDQRWINRQASFLQRRGFRDHLIISVLKDYGFGDP